MWSVNSLGAILLDGYFHIGSFLVIVGLFLVPVLLVLFLVLRVILKLKIVHWWYWGGFVMYLVLASLIYIFWPIYDIKRNGQELRNSVFAWQEYLHRDNVSWDNDLEPAVIMGFSRGYLTAYGIRAIPSLLEMLKSNDEKPIVKKEVYKVIQSILRHPFNFDENNLSEKDVATIESWWRENKDYLYVYPFDFDVNHPDFHRASCWLVDEEAKKARILTEKYRKRHYWDEYTFPPSRIYSLGIKLNKNIDGRFWQDMLNALADMKKEEIAPLLYPFLVKDSVSITVKIMIADIAADLEDKEAVHYLIELVRETSMQNELCKALSKITKQSFKGTYEEVAKQWEQWWAEHKNEYPPKDKSSPQPPPSKEK